MAYSSVEASNGCANGTTARTCTTATCCAKLNTRFFEFLISSDLVPCFAEPMTQCYRRALPSHFARAAICGIVFSGVLPLPRRVAARRHRSRHRRQLVRLDHVASRVINADHGIV